VETILIVMKNNSFVKNNAHQNSTAFFCQKPFVEDDALLLHLKKLCG
jgi:hypothetical protein